MSTTLRTPTSQFALDVIEGLTDKDQKKLPPRYFYDDLGSVLFEAITLLPEYGLTRADESLLQTHAHEIAGHSGAVPVIAELGSGSGRKTAHLLRAFSRITSGLRYCPIDVSAGALAACEKELSPHARVDAVCGDWLDGLAHVSRSRTPGLPLLLLFLGSSVGNLERADLPAFLALLRSFLHPGDLFLLGADLVKDVDLMLAAYDDPTGVTAAFNLNILGRINREFKADFDLRAFAHEVRWNAGDQRIEMHLLSCREQRVCIPELDLTVPFHAGETIWTESSHKFTEPELHRLAQSAGFTTLASWTDREWPFVETLWRVNG